jgi:hypothetical protein
MAKLGFIVDYTGRLAVFMLILISPAEFIAGWLPGLVTIVIMAAVWFGSRLGRYVLAGHAIDPVLQMPLSWW